MKRLLENMDRKNIALIAAALIVMLLSILSYRKRLPIRQTIPRRWRLWMRRKPTC